MNGDGNGDQDPGGPGDRLTRRRLLGIGAAVAAVGGLAAQGAIRAAVRHVPTTGKLAVLATCLGCTGCVVVCPEAALSIEPGCRIAVADESCTRCGYCVAACPVDALRVVREAGDA